MSSNGHSSQETNYSQTERNRGIFRGNHFSGRVTESLHDAPVTDAQDIVWDPLNGSHDTVDGTGESDGGNSEIILPNECKVLTEREGRTGEY